MNYTRKTLNVEARRVEALRDLTTLALWVNENREPSDLQHAWHNGQVLVVRSLIGYRVAAIGDWIIKEDGHFRVCPADEFTELYTAVDPAR